MRITQAMSLNTVLAAESRAAEQMGRLTEMASSGLRVGQPSDDPAAYASIVQRDAQIATVQGRSSAATLAATNLGFAENTLDQATTLLEKARSLAVEQANATLTGADRSNAATQIDGLRQQLLALANARGSSGYVFGGTKTGSPPFDPSGAFVGNDGAAHVEVADGVLVRSNASGAQAFTAAGGGRDVFADLTALSAAFSSNNVAAIQASLVDLDASHQQLLAARIDTGERAGRLQSASDAMNSALTLMQTARASEADADAPSTFSNLQASQAAYQQALLVNKQILSLAFAQNGN